MRALSLLLPIAIAACLAIVAACDDAGEDVPDGADVTATQTSPLTPAPSQPASPSVVPVTPTAAPVPSGWEQYVDADFAFSFPRPPGLSTKTEYLDVGGKDGSDVLQRRTVSFVNPDGVTAFGVGVEANPENLSLEEWARNDGWPSEPEQVTIGGEKGLLFPVNEMGDRYPVAIVKHGDKIFMIGGNVFGVPGAGYPPGISEADFGTILAEFKFGD